MEGDTREPEPRVRVTALKRKKLAQKPKRPPPVFVADLTSDRSAGEEEELPDSPALAPPFSRTSPPPACEPRDEVLTRVDGAANARHEPYIPGISVSGGFSFTWRELDDSDPVPPLIVSLLLPLLENLQEASVIPGTEEDISPLDGKLPHVYSFFWIVLMSPSFDRFFTR